MAVGLKFVTALIISLIVVTVGGCCLGIMIGINLDNFTKVGTSWARNIAEGVQTVVTSYIDIKEATMFSAGYFSLAANMAGVLPSEVATRYPGVNWTDIWLPHLLHETRKVDLGFSAYTLFWVDGYWMYASPSRLNRTLGFYIDWIELADAPPSVPYKDRPASVGGRRWYMNGTDWPFDESTNYHPETQWVHSQMYPFFRDSFTTPIKVLRRKTESAPNPLTPQCFWLGAPNFANQKAAKVYWENYGVCDFKNSTGHVLGYGAFGLGITRDLESELRKASRTVHGQNFLIDTYGYISGTSVEASWWYSYPSTQFENPPHDGCANSGAFGNLQDITMGCRLAWNNFSAYPPLTVLSKDFVTVDGEFFSKIEDPIDGAFYYVHSKRINAGSGGYQVNIVSFVPESDLNVEEFRRSFYVAIGICLGVFVGALVIALSVLHFTIKRLQGLEDKMNALAKLQTLDKDDSLYDDDEEDEEYDEEGYFSDYDEEDEEEETEEGEGGPLLEEAEGNGVVVRTNRDSHDHLPDQIHSPGNSSSAGEIDTSNNNTNNNNNNNNNVPSSSPPGVDSNASSADRLVTVVITEQSSNGADINNNNNNNKKEKEHGSSGSDANAQKDTSKNSNKNSASNSATQHPADRSGGGSSNKKISPSCSGGSPVLKVEKFSPTNVENTNNNNNKMMKEEHQQKILKEKKIQRKENAQVAAAIELFHNPELNAEELRAIRRKTTSGGVGILRKSSRQKKDPTAAAADDDRLSRKSNASTSRRRKKKSVRWGEKNEVFFPAQDANSTKNYSIFTEVAAVEKAYESTARALTNYTRYVPKSVVNELMSQRKFFNETGGAEATLVFHDEVTVSFTDIEGFSSNWEAHHDRRDALCKMLHVYFKRMCRLIMGHGGVVDRFLGDSVMSYWGAPNRTEYHALLAVLSALSIQREAARDPLDKLWLATLKTPLKVRSGIVTGKAHVGSVGTAERLNYTVIGAPVLTSKVLTGLNNQLKTKIICDQHCVRQCFDAVCFRTLFFAHLRGSKDPVFIYEPFGLDVESEIVRDRVLAKIANVNFGASSSGIQHQHQESSSNMFNTTNIIHNSNNDEGHGSGIAAVTSTSSSTMKLTTTSNSSWMTRTGGDDHQPSTATTLPNAIPDNSVDQHHHHQQYQQKPVTTSSPLSVVSPLTPGVDDPSTAVAGFKQHSATTSVSNSGNNINDDLTTSSNANHHSDRTSIINKTISSDSLHVDNNTKSSFLNSSSSTNNNNTSTLESSVSSFSAASFLFSHQVEDARMRGTFKHRNGGVAGKSNNNNNATENQQIPSTTSQNVTGKFGTKKLLLSADPSFGDGNANDNNNEDLDTSGGRNTANTNNNHHLPFIIDKKFQSSSSDNTSTHHSFAFSDVLSAATMESAKIGELLSKLSNDKPLIDNLLQWHVSRTGAPTIMTRFAERFSQAVRECTDRQFSACLSLLQEIENDRAFPDEMRLYDSMIPTLREVAKKGADGSLPANSFVDNCVVYKV